MDTVHVGDRVVCTRPYQGGVEPGEAGIVIGIQYDLVYIRWDEYSSIRHNCDGLCERGHGWNVPLNRIKPERCDVDFGELPILDIMELI